jgi:hypothetical protein
MTIKSGIKPEGSAASQLVQLMQHHGYNKDIDIEVGTVTADPPALKIKIDNMSIELEADDLIVAERLTKRTEKITIKSAGKTVIKSSQVTESMQQAGDPLHTHGITSTTLSGADLTVTEAEIEYLDELAVGDRVIVASTDKGQTYMILDRAVMY